MTLLVAAISDSVIWMVSDTAITGGNIDLRQREYLPKIEPAKAGNALVGFAGDAALGAQFIRLAAAEETPFRAIRILVDGSRNSELQFAFAFFDENGPLLLRIENGNVESVQSLYLGVHEAFEGLQRIRLGQASAHVPLAFKNFMCGARIDVPEPLSETIKGMIDLFASREEHDVGGWAVPYLLNRNGTFFCGYCYGVSDPIFDRLIPGSLIPHGTAGEGGSTLSVTELGNAEGMVVYWLQIPGGTVLVRNEEGYDLRVFSGGPTSFRRDAQAALGRPVELWVGDQPPGAIKSLTIMRNSNGGINAVIADHGDTISFAVHNLATPFESRAELVMTDPRPPEKSSFVVTVAQNKKSVTLQVGDEAGVEGVALDAQELDRFIFELGLARAELCEQVPAEFPARTKVAAQVDPRWYTDQSPHPSLPGVMLKLRHSGLGWLAFIFPPHEVRSLGAWLSGNVPEEKISIPGRKKDDGL